MSKLSGMLKLPLSVGGQPVPDFINFEIVEGWERPTLRGALGKYDSSIKKSPVFGQQSGNKFDEGAVWYPLREVKFALSDAGLDHYQARYPGQSTMAIGQVSPTGTIGLKLDKEEYIIGFRAYSNSNAIEGVRVWTNNGSHKDFGKVQGPAERGQDAEAFFVPADHEVVNFFGHTNADGHIHGLGVSYTRRLASLRSETSGPHPKEMKQISSRTYMDAATQQQWANNNMEAIMEKQKKAAKEVSAIYQHINDHDDKAWVKVRDPTTKEEYYLSWTKTAACWIYTVDEGTRDANADTKNAIVSIGSYSKDTNMLRATLSAAAIGMVFTYFIKPLIQEGVTWGIAFAASKLAQLAALAGVEALAIFIPEAVASTGGLVVAGTLGMLVDFGALTLMNVIWKKYWLILNVYNFDADHDWSNIDHFGDNSIVSNGEWKTKVVDKFVTGNTGVQVTPPGFDPVEPMDNVVTYLSMTFENDSTILGDLGEAVLMGRDDKQAGMALKYVVNRLKDNEIGLRGIEGDPSQFKIEGYYKGDGWVTATSIETKSGNLTMTGYTPALGGDTERVYTYNVNIGLPPPVTSNPRG